jgi:type I restriction enzyme S subunit
LIFKREDVPRSFVYWLLRTPQYRSYCRARAIGTTNLSLTRSDFLALPVPAPSATQLSLVALFDALESKIELNLQINATLEAIAQAIFTKLNISTDKVHLSDYVDLNPRLSIKKDAKVKYVEMSDLPEKGPSVKRYIYRPFTSGSKFQQLDTLLARITPCLENGKTALVDFLYGDEIAFGSTEFIVMRSKNDISPYYVYLLARNDNFREFAIKSMIGTSGRQRVQTDMLNNFELNYVESKEMKAFHETVRPLFEKMRRNSKQNRTLIQLRNNLLPKLISDKI